MGGDLRRDTMATDESETKTYRVRSVNLAANTKSTTWVRAPSRHCAEQHVRELYSRHMVRSALERTPPEGVDVIDSSGVAR